MGCPKISDNMFYLSVRNRKLNNFVTKRVPEYK